MAAYKTCHRPQYTLVARRCSNRFETRACLYCCYFVVNGVIWMLAGGTQNRTTQTRAKDARLRQATGQFGAKIEQGNAERYQDSAAANAARHGDTGRHKQTTTPIMSFHKIMIVTVFVAANVEEASIDALMMFHVGLQIAVAGKAITDWQRLVPLAHGQAKGDAPCPWHRPSFAVTKTTNARKSKIKIKNERTTADIRYPIMIYLGL